MTLNIGEDEQVWNYLKLILEGDIERINHVDVRDVALYEDEEI